MPTLHSLMALYGALDRVVVESDDVETAEVVERFLPGTTGPHAGWLRGIEQFYDTLPGPTVPFPRVDDALDQILGAGSADHLSVVQKSRLVYVLGALDQLPSRIYQSNPAFDRALGMVAPGGNAEGDETGPALRRLLFDEFASRDAWQSVTSKAVAQHLMSEEVARVPLCDTRLVEFGDRLYVEVVTQYEHPTLTLAQIKEILDPANWPGLSAFFRSMAPLNPTPRSDYWSRALEKVGTAGDEKCLTTALKFYKSERGNEIRVDYDLDDTAGPTFGDGLVTLDRGYLNVKGTGERGVSVRTKKLVYIQGLPSVSMKQWACITGYGAISMEMIFGGAQNPPSPRKAWEPSRSDGRQADEVHPDSEPDPLGSAPRPVRNPAAAATAFVGECATDMTTKSAGIAKKWAAGTLTLPDVVGYSAYVGARMASDPWRFLELVSRPSGPTTPRGRS